MIRDCGDERDRRPASVSCSRPESRPKRVASAPLVYLHDAQGLGLLHLAEDRAQDLVQLLPQLGPRPRNQRGDQPAHEGRRELGGAGVEQLVDHLHDVPEAVVALLVPPLGDLLQGHRDVGAQALATVLGRARGKMVNGRKEASLKVMGGGFNLHYGVVVCA